MDYNGNFGRMPRPHPRQCPRLRFVAAPDFWLRAGTLEVMGYEGMRVEARNEDGTTAMHLSVGMDLFRR